jgi:hypothetical protein
MSRVSASGLGDRNVVIEGIDIEVETWRRRGSWCRPKAGAEGRCSRCKAHYPGYGDGDRMRRWRAYGFHSPEAMIGIAMLTRGGRCPALPGRAA